MLRAKDKLDGKDINGREIHLINDMKRGSASPRRGRSRSRERRRFFIDPFSLVKTRLAAAVVRVRAVGRLTACERSREVIRRVAHRRRIQNARHRANRVVAALHRWRVIASELVYRCCICSIYFLPSAGRRIPARRS